MFPNLPLLLVLMIITTHHYYLSLEVLALTNDYLPSRNHLDHSLARHPDQIALHLLKTSLLGLPTILVPLRLIFHLLSILLRKKMLLDLPSIWGWATRLLCGPTLQLHARQIFISLLLAQIISRSIPHCHLRFMTGIRHLSGSVSSCCELLLNFLVPEVIEYILS